MNIEFVVYTQGDKICSDRILNEGPDSFTVHGGPIKKTSVLFRGSPEDATALHRRLSKLNVERLVSLRKVDRRFKQRQKELLNRYK